MSPTVRDPDAARAAIPLLDRAYMALMTAGAREAALAVLRARAATEAAITSATRRRQP